jgi:hypothetical protein
MNPDLRTAAAAEVERLQTARALIRDGDALALARLEAGGPWIGIARPKLRRRLAGTRLEIWRAGYEDASGRIVESRLVVIAVSAARPSEIARLLEAATVDWRRDVERVVAAFASTRLARESAIAASAAQTRCTPFQTGLFDRREQHEHAALEGARRAVEERLAERTASVQRANAIGATAPELLLVIAGARRS